MKKVFVSCVRFNNTAGLFTFTGENMKEILMRISNEHSYPIEEDDFDEHPGGLTEKMLLVRLDDFNADGCDYIISIIDDHGNIIYDCNKDNNEENKG